MAFDFYPKKYEKEFVVSLQEKINEIWIELESKLHFPSPIPKGRSNNIENKLYKIYNW